MKIYLEPLTPHGHNVLIQMKDVKKNANLAQKLGLKMVKFDLEVITTDPLKLRFFHGSFDRVPYVPVYADMVAHSLNGVFVQYGASLTDIKVTCE